jgi:secretion/DNA translocation related TadE-like protein
MCTRDVSTRDVSTRDVSTRDVGSRRVRDRGSGTLLMLAVVMFGGFLVLVSAALADAIVARHRAESAADLAALAAAGGFTGTSGCDQARRVAAENASRLEDCRRLPDGSVQVGVELPGDGSHLFAAVHTAARAGLGPGTPRGSGLPP